MRRGWRRARPRSGRCRARARGRRSRGRPASHARTTRASPQIRSATTGFRLCGMDDEPFWPRPNGSCTSPTSVRARCRTSSAKESSDDAVTASAASSSACRSRWRIWVEVGAGSSPMPLAREPLELGVGCGVGTDGARELADAHPLERARDPLPGARQFEGPAGELEPERRRLGVHAVRAADLQRLAVLLRPCRNGGEGAVEPGEDEHAGLLDLQRERGVDDVGGGEAVVEPAALLAELLGDGVDEGGRVVVERRLELGHALRARRSRLGDARGCLCRHDSQLGPGRRRCELDLEPGRELPLVRPDPGHGRAGVTGDHVLQSRAPTRRSSRLGFRRSGCGSRARRRSARCRRRPPRRERPAASARSRAARRGRRGR